VETSNWIALGAVAIAGASFAVTWLERRDRKNAVGEEREIRKEELRLLRAQVESDLASREHERRAELSATTGRVDGGNPRFDVHYFEVTNAGPAAAHDLIFQAVDEEGDVHTGAPLNVLLADQSKEIVREVPIGPSRAGGLKLRAMWHDGTGRYERDLVLIKRRG
jgi:hypothetical protein